MTCCKERYEFGEFLGKGSFAKVYRARDLETGENVAIKKYDTNFSGALSRERDILKRLDHLYVQRYLGHFSDSGISYLVTNFFEGRDLWQRIRMKEFPTPDMLSMILEQGVEALLHLQEREVIHRDIKPHNIIFGSKNIGLIDFGSAIVSSENNPYCAGTPSFMAPEQRDFKFEYSNDVWGLGMTLYAAAGGSVSCFGRVGEIPCDSEFKKIIEMMLRENPGYRISAFQLREITGKMPLKRLLKSPNLLLSVKKRFIWF